MRFNSSSVCFVKKKKNSSSVRESKVSNFNCY